MFLKSLLTSAILGSFLFLGGCSGTFNPAPASGDWDLKTVYMQPGWRSFSHLEDLFPVRGAIRKPKSSSNGGPLYVYIEGDNGPGLNIPNFGFTDIMNNVTGFDVPEMDVSLTSNKSTTTPVRSIALRMALQHEDDPILYVGQPCQYFSVEIHENCTRDFWQNERYSENAVLALDRAISSAKSKLEKDRPIILIGYDHGGTLAALVATVRNDVVGLITVASILALDQNRIQKGQSPLFRSLDPESLNHLLREIPHYHFSGENDDLAPSANADQYAASLGPDALFWAEVRKNNGHICCWEQDWPKLLLKALLVLDQHAPEYTNPEEVSNTVSSAISQVGMAPPEAAPPPRLPDYSGIYVVQVGAYLRLENAKAQWNRFRKFGKSGLQTAEPLADNYTDSRGRNFTRIYANGHETKTAANSQCMSFKTRGIDCWVHKVP